AIFKTQGDSVDENLRLYARGLLEELDEIHAGLHGN
ncbi:MAG TPA: dinitrogenase iron-molybdenum cofactor biosynthesis protein, partial [Clostridiaceae bacterium]|nr:dinitrogenase iron-molybdenum cofactor biosynthesis protein [Clostridiaceae bacterium]